MGVSSPAILSLLLGVALLTAGNALLGTLTSVRMTLEEFPRVVSGLVMSAYYVGFVLGTVHGARVITRVGHIRAFAAFAATLGVAATAHALVVDPLPWMLLRGLVGFAVAGELLVAESWLNATAGSTSRGRVFSYYVIVVYLAFGAGQFTLALGNPGAADLFLVVALLLSASILPIVLTRATAPIAPPTPRLPLRRMYERAPLGLTGAVAAGITVGGVQAIGPQFASELGLSVPRIAQFMGVFFLSGILLQWPVGRLSDRMDRRRVLAAMALVATLAAVAIATIADRSFPLLLALAVVGGGTMATLYPLSVAHANDRLHDESVISITATLLLAYGAGAASGPVLATTMMIGVGAAGLFYTAALPCAVLAVYAVFRVHKYAPVEQSRFEAVAHTTPAVLPLDPRTRPSAGEVGPEIEVEGSETG